MNYSSGTPDVHGAWRDAALHVIGDRTLYRTAGALPTEQLLIPTHKLALWKMGGFEPATYWYFQMFHDAELIRKGVSRRHSNGLSAYLDFVDAVDAVQKFDQIEACLRSLVDDGLVTCSGGKWSLTLAGVEKAVSLRLAFTDKNVTSLWVEHRVDDLYISRLTAALSLWCPRSAQFGELEDLIQNYLTNILRRDGFRNRIASGRPPALSDVKQWVYNAALSMWRDEGRDAQTRAFKGARTEKDLRQENDDDVATRSLAVDTQAIFLVTDGDGDVGAMSSSGSLPMPLMDVHGGNLEEEMIHRLSWQRGMERASAVVRRVKQGAPDRFDRLLHEVVEGDANYRDIGASEGVSRNRAAILVAGLRSAMIHEREVASLALRVFAYLKENPYSTQEDMESPVNDAAEASDGGLGESVPAALLDGLEEAGRIERTGEGDEACYRLTKAGEAALFDGDYFGVDLGIHRPSRGVGSTGTARV